MEWTLKQWQDHVIQMEKRMNEMEREIHRLKESQPVMSISGLVDLDHPHHVFKHFEDQKRTGNAPRLGEAWLSTG